MRGLFIALGAIVVVASVVSKIGEGNEWVDRYSANLATETLGILLTLVFVRRFLERQERARRLRGSIGALRKGSRALSTIAWTWGEVIRSSLRRLPSDPPHTLSQLLSGHLTEELSYWEPGVERRESDGSTESAGRWATHRFQNAQEALSEIIVTYGGSLDPSYVEAIDELVDDPFLRLVKELTAEGNVEQREFRIKMNAARAYREAHFHRLLQAIAVQNELATEAGQLRSRRTAPRTGSVGLKLELDHDLKVHLSVDPKWWWAQGSPTV
jgi:hypothetical protein